MPHQEALMQHHQNQTEAPTPRESKAAAAKRYQAKWRAKAKANPESLQKIKDSYNRYRAKQRQKKALTAHGLGDDHGVVDLGLQSHFMDANGHLKFQS